MLVYMLTLVVENGPWKMFFKMFGSHCREYRNNNVGFA